MGAFIISVSGAETGETYTRSRKAIDGTEFERAETAAKLIRRIYTEKRKAKNRRPIDPTGRRSVIL